MYIDHFLSTMEVSKRLGVSQMTVTNWLNQKHLKGLKLKGHWRVDPDDLDRFVQSCWNIQE